MARCTLTDFASGNRRASSSRLSRSESRWRASVSSARTCASATVHPRDRPRRRCAARPHRRAAGGAGRSARSARRRRWDSSTRAGPARDLPRFPGTPAMPHCATLAICAGDSCSRCSSRLQLAVPVQRAGQVHLGRTHGVAREPLAKHPHDLRALLRRRKPAQRPRQLQHPRAHRGLVGVARELEIARARRLVARDLGERGGHRAALAVPSRRATPSISRDGRGTCALRPSRGRRTSWTKPSFCAVDNRSSEKWQTSRRKPGVRIGIGHARRRRSSSSARRDPAASRSRGRFRSRRSRSIENSARASGPPCGRAAPSTKSRRSPARP